MALQGTLKDFSLADIFQLIGLQKKTGVLTLRGGAEVVTVSFLEGDVVTADSVPKRLEDRLGSVLVRSRQVEQAQLQEALMIQKQTLKRLGAVLVEKKFIAREALREALRIQVSQTIFRLFRWKDGEYHFSQDQKLDYDKENVSPISAETILMEGARILDEWPMIEARIGGFQGVFRSKAGPEAHAEGKKAGGPVLSAEEKIVLETLDGKRSVQGVIDHSPLSEFDTCRVLYELIDRGLVEKISSVPGAASPKAAASRSVSVAPRIRPSQPRLWGWALAILFGASVLTAPRNALNGWSMLTGADPGEARLLQQASLTRMERIRYALGVYFLQSRGFPKDLNYLVLGGLLRSPDLRDPWGREYSYKPLPGGFEIRGGDRSGLPDQTLTIRHVISLQ
jgi:hypothetical protein